MKYNYLSEQRMYEWSLKWKSGKGQHYAFFQRVKNLPLKDLSLEEIIRLETVREIQMNEFKKIG